jgi:HSP20 family molecular chaperone IbpA
MPADIDPDTVTARLEDGVLAIRAAKAEEAPVSREVQVE